MINIIFLISIHNTCFSRSIATNILIWQSIKIPILYIISTNINKTSSINSRSVRKLIFKSFTQLISKFGFQCDTGTTYLYLIKQYRNGLKLFISLQHSIKWRKEYSFLWTWNNFHLKWTINLNTISCKVSHLTHSRKTSWKPSVIFVISWFSVISSFISTVSFVSHMWSGKVPTLLWHLYQSHGCAPEVQL